MSLVLTRVSALQTTYVGVMNNNYLALENAINGLQAATGIPGTGGGAVGLIDLWDRDGLVGVSSFVVSPSSNTHLSVTGGTAWRAAEQSRAQAVGDQSLSFVGKPSGTYYVIADTTGTLAVSTTTARLALYQIAWMNPGFGSAERLVAYLLAGEDYAGMLSSPTFGAFTRVADRLSALEGGLGMGQYYDQRRLSGLSWHYQAGQVRNNAQVTSTASGLITLAASATVAVEVDPQTGVLSYALGAFTSGLIPLRYLKTSGGVLISNEDRRTWAVAGTGGSGGGGGSISGTTEAYWQLNMDVASVAPTSNAGLQVRRGASADVELRWNETLDLWEFTNDGITYSPLMGLHTTNLGQGRATRLNPVLSAPTVLAQANRSTTPFGTYEALSLSAYVSTTTTAVLLRGVLVESYPNGLVSAVYPNVAFYRDSATLTGVLATTIYAVPASHPQAETVLVPVSSQRCVYTVLAASDFSANLTMSLIAYYDLIAGVGTARVCGIATSLAVAAESGATFHLGSGFGAAMNRGLVHLVHTSAFMSAGNQYDIECYGLSNLAASSLLFQALGIDASAAYTARLPWFLEDLESSATLHFHLSNHGLSAALISLQLVGERFA